MRFILLLGFMLILAAPVFAAYDKPYVGDQVTYRTDYEDTFVHLARDYNLGFVEMRAANPTVDPWLPGSGTKIILPLRHILPDAPRDGIVINLPEMRLFAFVNGDEAPSTYAIGVGREGLNTPEGSTTVTRKKEGPTWTPTPRMRREDPELKPYYPPGPDNPLGTHALYLGWPQYAIHGTNRPFGIGRRISSGCIRMYPENIIKLFNTIPVGTKVTVVNQPIKLAWIEDRLYLEAHPELEQAIQMEEYGQVASPKLSEKDLQRIVEVAGAFEDKLRWPAIRTAIKERKGIPIEIARRPKNYDSSAAQEDADQDGLVELDPDDEEIIKELTGQDVAVEDEVEIEQADANESVETEEESKVVDAASRDRRRLNQ